MKRVFFTLICCLPLLLMAQVQKIAILETVDKKGDVPYAYKLMLRSNLTKAITNTPGYEGYDRADMEAIMGEQSFQRTGMVSDDQIRKLGEMTGAQFILVAEAVKVDEQNMFITAKILNVETAKTEKSDNVLMGIAPADILQGCEQLAYSLLGTRQNTQITHTIATNVPSETNQRAQENVSQKETTANTAISNDNILLKISGKGLFAKIEDVRLYIKTFSDGSKGLVFYEDKEGHGMAVSLDETVAKWEQQEKKKNCHDIPNISNVGAITAFNMSALTLTIGKGRQNTDYILETIESSLAPAASWCTNHGDNWYLPSIDEMYYLFVLLFSRLQQFNAILLRERESTFDQTAKYWTSTEGDKGDAWTIELKALYSASRTDKSKEHHVRAFRVF